MDKTNDRNPYLISNAGQIFNANRKHKKIAGKEYIHLTDCSGKSEQLQKLHTHSSAETSDIGDSLQKIHQLSSTETSGYCDTVPSPVDGNGRVGSQKGSPAHSQKSRQKSTMSNQPKRRPSMTLAVGRDYEDENNPTASYDEYVRAMEGSRSKSARRQSKDDRRRASQDASPVMTPGGSRKHGSFFGKGTSSTWITWSQDRRASFKKKMDTLEAQQKEMEKNRVSTPVRKARVESVMFVAPDLEDSHIPQAEPTQMKKPTKPPPKKKKAAQKSNVEKEEIKLTMSQWTALLQFWEHQIFVRCRYLGVLGSAIAFIAGIIAIVDKDWRRYEEHDIYGKHIVGLWETCSIYETVRNCTTVVNEDWHNAVIGLLVFAVAFGFLAAILSICGLCTHLLPKKIYYYHSAGEIFFICALSCTTALITYPVSIEVSDGLKDHTYGFGYGIGWVSAVFYYVAALCMCLDDIVRSCVKGCGPCGKKSTENVTV